MKNVTFPTKLAALRKSHGALLAKKNPIDPTWYNGVYERYKNPVVTAAHIPLEWRYDMSPKTNPFLMERMGINAALNAGAIEFGGKIVVCVRVEGWDRKSFFAMAESKTGIDGFRFWDEPCVIPETDNPDTNIYDMRLVKHEDGWIYGLFCTERRDPKAKDADQPSAVAQHERFKKVGAPARHQNAVRPAAQCRAASGIRWWEICALHAATRRIHRHRIGWRHRLGAVLQHGKLPNREGKHH